jgi:hypothetical protein
MNVKYTNELCISRFVKCGKIRFNSNKYHSFALNDQCYVIWSASFKHYHSWTENKEGIRQLYLHLPVCVFLRRTASYLCSHLSLLLSEAQRDKLSHGRTQEVVCLDEVLDLTLKFDQVYLSYWTLFCLFQVELHTSRSWVSNNTRSVFLLDFYAPRLICQ